MQCNSINLFMKNFIFILVSFFFSCTATQPKTIGIVVKNDQDVVNILGMPGSVANYELKGKIYFYNYLSENRCLNFKYYEKVIIDGIPKAKVLTFQNIFYFDSANSVLKYIKNDSSYISKGDFYQITRRR